VSAVHGLLTELVVNGIGIAAAPWCIIGVILILSAPGGLRKAIAFLAGAATAMVVIYAACSAAVGHLALAAPESAASGITWAKLAAGLALLAFGLWRLRRPPHPSASPRWLGLVDRLSARVAFAAGLVMPNPIFAAAGAVQIVKAGLAPAAAAAYLLVFIVVALSTMLAPALLYARSPASASARLERWKAWLAPRTAQILTALVIGYGGLISVHAVLALR
jgi:Sap, sulfolipid-1-addressing protein